MRLVAGEVTGDAAAVAVSATRGIRMPVFVERTSSIDDASGVMLVDEIPT
ncbi:hypothetical protein SDC9_73913 [bioreactor metagenome]|uniref:Uncharacterized protein n=1 Tax=bioreactor metagenome TaxID=1076179 RepID=A0A644YFL8_9ZZZZ